MTSLKYTYGLRCHGQRNYVTFTSPEDFQAPFCPSCGHTQNITKVSSVEVERPDYSRGD